MKTILYKLMLVAVLTETVGISYSWAQCDTQWEENRRAHENAVQKSNKPSLRASYKPQPEQDKQEFQKKVRGFNSENLLYDLQRARIELAKVKGHLQRSDISDLDSGYCETTSRKNPIPSWEPCMRAAMMLSHARYAAEICEYEQALSKGTNSSATSGSNTQRNDTLQNSTSSVFSNQNNPSNSSQHQSQQLQAAAAQAVNRARESQQQGDADAQRRGRRVHDPAAEAHECIRPIFTGLFGSFENSCNYPVHYSYCAYRPKSDSWLTILDCEKQQFGSAEVGPNRQSAAHTKGAESIHWFACKNPAWALDKSFDGGQIQGRCRVVGGN
jgi:hypothetical protein